MDERANKVLYRIFRYFGIWCHSVREEICIQWVVCIATGPQPLLKQFLQKLRSSASSFKFQYLLFSLMLFTSYLCLLPRIPVPSIFLSITCFYKAVSTQDILLCVGYSALLNPSRKKYQCQISVTRTHGKAQCISSLFFSISTINIQVALTSLRTFSS